MSGRTPTRRMTAINVWHGMDVTTYVIYALASTVKSLIAQAIDSGDIKAADFLAEIGERDLNIYLMELGDLRRSINRALIVLAALQGKQLVITLEDIRSVV